MADRKRKSNANFISLLVSGEARREKSLARTEGGFGVKGEAQAPLIFSRLAWQLGICSASITGRAETCMHPIVLLNFNSENAWSVEWKFKEPSESFECMLSNN